MKNQTAPRYIKRSDIVRQYLGCPYCGNKEFSGEDDASSCCGETVAHAETVYVLKDGEKVHSNLEEIIVNDEGAPAPYFSPDYYVNRNQFEPEEK